MDIQISIPSPKLTGNTHGFYGTVGAFKPNQQKHHKRHGRYATIGTLPPSDGDDDDDSILSKPAGSGGIEGRRGRPSPDEFG